MIYAVGTIRGRTKRKNNPCYGFKIFDSITKTFEYVDYNRLSSLINWNGAKIENLVLIKSENDVITFRGKYNTIDSFPSYYNDWDTNTKKDVFNLLKKRAKTVTIIQIDIDDSTEEILRFHAVDSETGYFIIDNTEKLKAVLNKIVNITINGNNIDIKCKKNRIISNSNQLKLEQSEEGQVTSSSLEKQSSSGNTITDVEATNKDIDWSLLRFMQYYSQKVDNNGSIILNKINIIGLDDNSKEIEVKPSNLKNIKSVKSIFIDMAEFNFNILHLPCGVDKVKIKLKKGIDINTLIVGKRTNKVEFSKDLDEKDSMIKINNLHIMSDKCNIFNSSFDYLDIDNYSMCSHNYLSSNFNNCVLPYMIESLSNCDKIFYSFNDTVFKNNINLNLKSNKVSYSFNRCKNISSITVEKANDEKFTFASIDSSFNYYSNLSIYDIKTKGIKILTNCFRNVQLTDTVDLDKVILNTDKFSLVQAFSQENTVEIKEINLTNRIDKLLSSFNNVSLNHKLDIPESLKRLDESSFKNGYLTWNNSNLLNEITAYLRGVYIEADVNVDSENMTLKNKGDKTYYDITFSNGHSSKYLYNEIVDLPEQTTKIGALAFTYSKIKHISGNNITKIGEGAFLFSELQEFNSLEFPNLKRIEHSILGSTRLERIVLADNLEYVTSELIYNKNYGLDRLIKTDGTTDNTILRFLSKNLKDIIIADTVQLNAPILIGSYELLEKYRAINVIDNLLTVHVVKDSSAHKVYSNIKNRKFVLKVYDSREELYEYNHVTKEQKEQAMTKAMMLQEIGDLTDNKDLNSMLLKPDYINNALKIVETYEELNADTSSTSTTNKEYMTYKESELYSEELTSKVKSIFYKTPLRLNWEETDYLDNRLEKVEDSSIVDNIVLDNEPIQLISYLNLVRMMFKREDNLLKLSSENLNRYLVEIINSDSEFNAGNFMCQFAGLLYNKNNFRIEVIALNRILGHPEETYDSIRVNYLALIYTNEIDKKEYILYMTPVSLDDLQGHKSILYYVTSGMSAVIKSDINISALKKLYLTSRINNRRYLDDIANKLTIGDSCSYNNTTINKIKYPYIAGNIFGSAMSELLITNTITIPLDIKTSITKREINKTLTDITSGKIGSKSVNIEDGTEYLCYNLVNQKFYILASIGLADAYLRSTEDLTKNEYGNVLYYNEGDRSRLPYIDTSSTMTELMSTRVIDMYNAGDVYKHKKAMQLLTEIRDNNTKLFSNNSYKFFIMTNEEQQRLYNEYKEEHKYKASDMQETDNYSKISDALYRVISNIGYKKTYNFIPDTVSDGTTEVEYLDVFYNGNKNLQDNTEVVHYNILSVTSYSLEKLFNSPLATKLSETKLLNQEEKTYIMNNLRVNKFYKLNSGEILEEYKYSLYLTSCPEYSEIQNEYSIYLYRYNISTNNESSDAFILPDRLTSILNILVENQDDIIYRYYSYNNSKFRYYQREQDKDIVLLLNRDIKLINSTVRNIPIHHTIEKVQNILSYINFKDRFYSINLNIALDKESEELFLVAGKQQKNLIIKEEIYYYKIFRFKNIENLLMFIDRIIFKNSKALISLSGLVDVFNGNYYTYEQCYRDNGMYFKDEFINLIYRLQFNDYTPNMPNLLETNIFDYIELFSKDL